jgi:hypothetical protein
MTLKHGSPARSSKAAAAWSELNDRQQGTLAVIYELDQLIETSRRKAAALGEYDRRPAGVWRRIDFAHEPSLRKMVGWTEMQTRLETRGWDNQGNGSTLAALEARELINRGSRPTSLGVMLTVSLTAAGRAAARAGTSTMPGRVAKPALSPRSWEVLALLWAAGQRGQPLKWGYSRTIEFSLMDRRVPPLAEDAGGGYAITSRGRDFYREHYAAHVAAYPDVHAPHPGGASAEPWPKRADEILTQHRQYYHALCAAWQDACDACRSAETEARAEPPGAPAGLPAAVTQQQAARYQLWRDTARQRAGGAASETQNLQGRAEHAARVYAVAALAAFRAAVLRADPLQVLQPPSLGDDDWDEQPLPPPPETGIHAIDTEAEKRHAAAAGAPLRRRGPAPKQRRKPSAAQANKPEKPGSPLAELAGYLHTQVSDGALTRRLHPLTPDATGPLVITQLGV